jgi:predicted nicotinamide N-methyase
MSLDHMTFSIPSGGDDDGDDYGRNLPLTIHLRQATDGDANQGDNQTNTGFVIWPAAVMLAHYLTENPILVLSDDTRPHGDIMELGAGCGLAGLAAAMLLDKRNHQERKEKRIVNQDRVIFTDYNPACLENLRLNVLLNNLDSSHEVLGLDWFDQLPSDRAWLDMNGASHARCRLILGADLIVCTNDADLVAATIDCALIEGGMAIILGADRYARFGVSSFPRACRSRGLTVKVDEDILESREDDIGKRLLVDALELGGYRNGKSSSVYDFTMFTINKPITPV